MGRYLYDCNHPVADIFQSLDLDVLNMHWRTKENVTDCGVFTMRHMETYMGGGAHGWLTGLAQESPVQDRKLFDLRKKYVTKMLLSENNKRKEFVEAEIEDFDSNSE